MSIDRVFLSIFHQHSYRFFYTAFTYCCPLFNVIFQVRIPFLVQLKHQFFFPVMMFSKYIYIVLKNGDKNARQHYMNILREHPDWEKKLMLELYKEGNPDLKYDIEERAAISECSIEDAIRMLMKN